MGTPVPPDSPDLEDAKWYDCYLDMYLDPSHTLGCDGVYYYRKCCCETGAKIQAWLDAGGECNNTNVLFKAHYLEAQRLIAIHGPYDNWWDCDCVRCDP